MHKEHYVYNLCASVARNAAVLQYIKCDQIPPSTNAIQWPNVVSVRLGTNIGPASFNVSCLLGRYKTFGRCIILTEVTTAVTESLVLAGEARASGILVDGACWYMVLKSGPPKMPNWRKSE